MDHGSLNKIINSIIAIRISKNRLGKLFESRTMILHICGKLIWAPVAESDILIFLKKSSQIEQTSHAPHQPDIWATLDLVAEGGLHQDFFKNKYGFPRLAWGMMGHIQNIIDIFSLIVSSMIYVTSSFIFPSFSIFVQYQLHQFRQLCFQNFYSVPQYNEKLFYYCILLNQQCSFLFFVGFSISIQ